MKQDSNNLEEGVLRREVDTSNSDTVSGCSVTWSELRNLISCCILFVCLCI